MPVSPEGRPRSQPEGAGHVPFEGMCSVSQISLQVDEDTLVAFIDQRLELLVERIRAELNDGWLDTQQAAAYTGYSAGYLLNQVHEGKLARNGPKGHKHRWTASQLDAWLASRGESAGKPPRAGKIDSATGKGAAIPARIPRRGTGNGGSDAQAD
jgi:hypothetical protein